MTQKITFHREWYEAIKDLRNDVRLEVYDAIVQYAFDGSLRGFSSAMVRAVFLVIKQRIDSDNLKRVEIAAKRSSAGKRGGAPKNNRNAIRNKDPEQIEVSITAPTQQANLFGDVKPVEQQEKPKKPTKQGKHKYAEFVLLTDDEYNKLVDAHGKDGADWLIKKLDDYKAARGMTYKSDYRAILNWVVKELEKQKMTYGRNQEHRGNNETQSTQSIAKQQRDAEFAEFIERKLTSN